MKIAVLGTGDVGRNLGAKLVAVGHDVRLGSRSATNEVAAAWARDHGASHGSFADAAAFAELVVNATKGDQTLAALDLAGRDNLAGKVLIDVSNPLDFSQGFPPRLSTCNDSSLGEQIQAAHPDAKVVKTLNTMANAVMVSPRTIEGAHHCFICGNDAEAKGKVRALLLSFGWNADELIDLGDITNARGTEMYLPLWTRIYRASGTGAFNIRIVKAPAS